MDKSQRIVYKETIIRYLNRRAFTKRDFEFRERGCTLLDTWENDFGNVYAWYCWGREDEERTFNVTGYRYGIKYKPSNEKFKESLLKRQMADYIKERFLNLTKQELVQYIIYLYELLENMDEEQLDEIIKTTPIERDKRLAHESKRTNQGV